MSEPIEEQERSAPPRATKKAVSTAKAVVEDEAVERHGDTSVLPSLKMVPDRPVDEDPNDTLGFDAYADALAGLIQHAGTEMPLTLAINAPWGAGKSSLAAMVAKRLTVERQAAGLRPYIVCQFNAWMHDDATNLAASFTAQVARAADAHRSLWRKLLRPLPYSLWPGRRKKLFFLAIMGLAGLFSAAFVGVLISAWAGPQFKAWVLSYLGVKGPSPLLADAGAKSVTLTTLTGLLGLAGAAYKKLSGVGQSIASYIADPKKAADRASIAEARAQLTSLVADATQNGRRFVIFIDDIERVQPPRAIDVLEVVNQLLCDARVVTVLMGDMPAVAACAGIKYKELAAFYSPGSSRVQTGPYAQQAYGRHYLQKIVQLQFDLPPHRRERIDRLMTRLTDDEPSSASGARGPSSEERLRRRHQENMKSALAGLYLGLASIWKRDPPKLNGARPLFSMLGHHAMLIYAWFAAGLLALYGIVSLLIGGPVQAGALFGCAVVLVGLALVLRRRKHRIWTAENDRIIESEIQAVIEQWQGLVDSKTVRDEVLRRLNVLALSRSQKEQLEALIKQKLGESLMGDTKLLREAHAAALDHLPFLPRNAKRLLNSLRLMLYVYRERGLVPSQTIGPEHVGKWAALRERWPELAQAMLRDPSLCQRLEELASADGFSRAIAKTVPEIAEDDGLPSFFRTEPTLGAAMPSLVHYHSVEPTTREDVRASRDREQAPTLA